MLPVTLDLYLTVEAEDYGDGPEWQDPEITGFDKGSENPYSVRDIEEALDAQDMLGSLEISDQELEKIEVSTC